MTLLDDIAIAINGLSGSASPHTYHVFQSGQVVFSSDMSDYTVTAMCTVADPLISLDDIPDRYQLAATYYILHRYWSTRDANQANYYRSLYDIEYAKVIHNRLQPLMSYLGDDL